MHHPKGFDRIPIPEGSAVIRLVAFGVPEGKTDWGDLGALPPTGRQGHGREAGEPNIQWFLVSVHRLVLPRMNWPPEEHTERREAGESIAPPGFEISRLGWRRQMSLHSGSLSFSLGAPPKLFAPSIS
jgi:hypothetical protein